MKMSVGVLDHYNVSTRKLDETVHFRKWLRQRATASSSRQNDSDKSLSGSGQRLQPAFDRDKAVDGIQFIAQPGRVIHVIVLVPISWPHFEDDGDHCSPTQEKFVVGMQRRDATLFPATPFLNA